MNPTHKQTAQGSAGHAPGPETPLQIQRDHREGQTGWPMGPEGLREASATDSSWEAWLKPRHFITQVLKSVCPEIVKWKLDGDRWVGDGKLQNIKEIVSENKVRASYDLAAVSVAAEMICMRSGMFLYWLKVWRFFKCSKESSFLLFFFSYGPCLVISCTKPQCDNHNHSLNQRTKEHSHMKGNMPRW